jgi:hypothetical protein
MTTATKAKTKATEAGSHGLQDKHREIAIIAGLGVMGKKGRKQLAA